MWTPEDEKIIRENHGKKTLSQINSLLSNSVGYYALRSKTQRMGLYRDRIKNKLPNKNLHNTNYWENPNSENCYWAGFVAADGHLALNANNTHVFVLKLSTKDESHIDKIISDIGFTGKKCYSTCKSPSSERQCFQVYFKIVGFEQNASYLLKHFNTPLQKTFRLGPTNLQDVNLNLAFLTGLIDGDGSVEFQMKGKSGGHLYLGVNSCSEPIVQWVKTIIDANFPYQLRPSNVRKHKEDGYYRFYVGGVRAAIIFERLSSLNTPKLPRKWQNPQILQY